MPTDRCPPPGKLQDYLHGKLGIAEQDQLSAHLEDCADCEQVATQIELRPDTFVELLQSDLPISSTEHKSSQFALGSEHVSGESSQLPGWSSTSLPSEIASYELLRELGHGGMGAVYLARHRKLDKQVAVKLLPAFSARLPEFVARFQREMRAAGRLEHPAIVRTTDAGEQDGVHFLVMDAIDGMDLSRIARAAPSMSVADACEVARQAALGLAHAHASGVVHRDIKPSNLMLDTVGKVRILDFGLAQVGLWDSGSAEITTVGQLMGTLDYMAPEQAERGTGVDYRVDLYSLGATLFRLLTGRAPLAAAPDMTPLEKLRLLSTHSAPSLQTLRPDAPEGLTTLLGSLLARDPSQRPASASHAAELLTEFCDEAHLPELLQRSRRLETEEASSNTALAPLGSLARTVPGTQPAGSASGAATQEEYPPRRKPPGRTFGMLGMAASLLALAAFGIVFIVDTAKGQLVIESLDADVQVSVRQDGVVLDELQIEPGSHSTRLWGGKYEIKLDTGSDRFSVSLGQFTIRRGETVVARITTKQPKADAITPTGIGSPNDSQAEDGRLTEIVYEGKSLDTWLRGLEFERSEPKIEQSLTAVSQLATPETRDLVEPRLVEFLLRRIKGGKRDKVGFLALRAASGDEFCETILPLLSAGTATNMLDVLDDINTKNSAFRGISPELTTPLTQWITTALRTSMKNQDFPHQVVRRMLDLVNHGNIEQPVPGTLAAIRTLYEQGSKAEQRMLESIWFKYSAGNTSRWPAICQAEALQWGSRLLQDDAANIDLRCRAALVMHSILINGFTPTPQSAIDLKLALRSVLNATAQDPYRYVANKPLGRDFSTYAIQQPIPGNPLKQTSETPPSLPNFVFAIIGAMQSTDALRDDIQRVHTTFDNLAIAQLHAVDLLSQPLDESNIVQLRFAQTIFYQSGVMLGLNSRDLVRRFSQLPTLDRAVFVDATLTDLEQNVSHAMRSMSILVAYLDQSNASRALPDLVRLLSRAEWETLDVDSRQASIRLLARVSGEDFFKHFTAAIRASEDPTALLATDFATLQEFGCDDPKLIEPLLDWTDQVCRGAEADAAIAKRAIAMLRSLLADRRPTIAKSEETVNSVSQPTGLVADSVQVKIIEHLEDYPAVDDKFWFGQPWASHRAQRNTTTKMGRAFGETLLRRGTVLLEKGADRELECAALCCMKSYLASGITLSEQQQASLAAMLDTRFTAAANDFDNALGFVTVSNAFGVWSLPIAVSGRPTQIFRETGHGSAPYSANALLLMLDVAKLAKLGAQLEESLQAIYDRSLDTDLIATAIQPSSLWRSLTSGRDARNVAIQAIQICSGLRLGKDLAALRQIPEHRHAKMQVIARKTAHSGDTLAIYVENVLPGPGSPLPVMQAGKGNPVVGYPVPISASGVLVLPLLQPMQVDGLSLVEIQQKLLVAYKKIVKAPKVSVNMLSQANSRVELRSLSSPLVARPDVSSGVEQP